MLPHGGAMPGFRVPSGYALSYAVKAAQIADTGATAWKLCFSCAFNLCFNEIGIFSSHSVLVQLLYLAIIPHQAMLQRQAMFRLVS